MKNDVIFCILKVKKNILIDEKPCGDGDLSSPP